MGDKILVVVTNHAKLGDTGKQTGWYLPEVAHPWEVFKNANIDITYVSPNGGKAPMDEGSGEAFKGDPMCQEFLKHEEKNKELENTKKPGDINPKEYKALFYAGGHGPMFDIPECDAINKLGQTIYEQGGILGAVCHGTVGFVNIKLSSKEYLVKGQKVTSFTNSEEDAVQLSKAMPFMLETKLKEHGAEFVGAEDWQEHVVVSGRLVTGQNPASATKVAKEIVTLMQTKS